MQRDLFFKSRCKITVFLPIIGVLFPRKIGIDHKKCTFYEKIALGIGMGKLGT